MAAKMAAPAELPPPAPFKTSTGPVYRTVAANLCESLSPQFLSCFQFDKECSVHGVTRKSALLRAGDRDPVKSIAQCTKKGISLRNQELHDVEAPAPPSSVVNVAASLSDMFNKQSKPGNSAGRFSILVNEATTNGAQDITDCFPEMHAFFTQHSLGSTYDSLRGFPIDQATLTNPSPHDAGRCILLGDSGQMDAKKAKVKVEPIVCFVLQPGTELPHPFQYVPDNTPPGHLTIAPCLGPAEGMVCSILPLKVHLRASALDALPWKVHCLQLKAAALPPELRAPFDPDTHRLACLIFDYFEELCAEQEGARASDWLAFVLAAEYPALQEDRAACFSARGNAELLTILGGVIESYDDDDAAAAAREIAGMAQRFSIGFEPEMAASAPTAEKSETGAQTDEEHAYLDKAAASAAKVEPR